MADIILSGKFIVGLPEVTTSTTTTSTISSSTTTTTSISSTTTTTTLGSTTTTTTGLYTGIYSHPEYDEEFFGILGDAIEVTATGVVATDVANLQAAFDNVGQEGYPIYVKTTGHFALGNNVLYLDNKSYIGWIGSGKATNTFTFTGAANDSPFHFNGVAYSYFGRFKIICNNDNLACIEQQWDNHTNTFDTDNEFFDIEFDGSLYGIRGGDKVGTTLVGNFDASTETNLPTGSKGDYWNVTGSGTVEGLSLTSGWIIYARKNNPTIARDFLVLQSSDNSVGFGYADIDFNRCTFKNNAQAGSWVGNFNALDIRHRWCTFENCGYGMSNVGGAGNFEGYNCVFKNCTSAALGIRAGQNHELKNSYIENCGRAIECTFSSNSAQVTFTNNTVVDCAITPIMLQNAGPLVLIGNTFKQSSSTDAVVSFATPDTAGIVTNRNNTFSSTFSSIVFGATGDERVYTKGQSIVDVSTMITTEPTLPGEEPFNNRPVYIATVGATAAQIQTLINQADSENRYNRPIVFLPEGEYVWTTSVIIPSGSDVVLKGEVYRSRITMNVASTPAIIMQGPIVKSTVEDIRINCGTLGRGIKIVGADEIGSKVNLHNCELQWGQLATFSINNVNNVSVGVINTGFPYGPGTGIKVTSPVDLHISGGQGATDTTMIDLSGGANCVIEGFWSETGGINKLVNITNASLAMSNCRLNTPVSNPLYMDIKTGANFLLEGSFPDANVKVSGTGNKVLVIANQFKGYITEAITDTSTGDVRALFNWDADNNHLPDQGAIEDAFIDELFAPLEAVTQPRMVRLNDDQSDVRLRRVFVNEPEIGVEITN